MDVILSVGFNSQIREYFQIKNPAILPLQGEVFNCTWSDFLTDENILELLDDYDENGCWLVDVVSKDFSKDKITYNISLMEEEHYYKHQKYLRERGQI